MQHVTVDRRHTFEGQSGGQGQNNSDLRCDGSSSGVSMKRRTPSARSELTKRYSGENRLCRRACASLNADGISRAARYVNRSGGARCHGFTYRQGADGEDEEDDIWRCH